MNWLPPQSIRPHVQGIFLRGDEMLVCRITNHDRTLKGYRAPGGGIEFGELSEAALHREILEELGQPIKILRRLGMSENVFTFEGHKGHELTVFHLAEFTNPAIYSQQKIPYTEADKLWDHMLWLNPRKADMPMFPTDLPGILKNI